jgi:hypothetical protein
MKSLPSWLFFAAFTSAAMSQTACTQNKVVGRYKSADCVDLSGESKPCRDVEPKAEIAVITIATPGGTAVAPNATVPAPSAASPAPAISPSSSSPPSGLSLPERALATYITLLANPKIAKSAATLRQNIAAPIKAEQPPSTDDRTIFHRTMIVTVARDPLLFNPADRIEAVDVRISPDNAVIKSWDTAATIYSTINAGSIQLTGTQTGSASASVGAPSTAPITGSLTGSFTQTESRVENFTATQQAESLTISLINNDTYHWDVNNRNMLRIHRQGGIGIDLTGNIVIKVDIVLPQNPGASPDPIYISRRWLFSVKGDYFDKQGKRANPASLSLNPQLALVAKHVNPSIEPTPVTATVAMTYTLRHVLSGDETLEEKDDTIIERTVETKPRSVILVPGEEASPRAYSIVSDLGRGATLLVQRPGAPGAQYLCFASYDAANDLVTYLKQANAQPEIVGNARLGFSAVSDHQIRLLQTMDLKGLEAVGACPD